MKKILLCLMVGLTAMSCEYSYTEKYSYDINEPVITPLATFRSSVKVTNSPKQIGNYGKICFYNGFLFIAEPQVGIHIIDNRVPAAPNSVGFIELTGNADIAVRNGLLYADALIDLVWFDLTDPSQPRLAGRLENAFPDALPPLEDECGYDYEAVYNAKEQGVVTGWKLTHVEKEVQRTRFVQEDAVYLSGEKSFSSNGNGVNGSMSRFALKDDYLYAVINYQMQIFDLSGETPQKVEDAYPFWVGDVETIFAYKDCMFLGMTNGMAIYSVENPTKPEYCSTVSHVLGCDPVVVDNDLAYVTVHSGNFCGQDIDELFIVDVSDVRHPRQLVSYTMTNPKGLGIDGDRRSLFLCDDGLKIFRIGDDPQMLKSNLITHIIGMDGYDLIPFDNTLMMIADNGLYQYDYTDLDNIKPLSVIPVNQQ